jgi:hypothetical protein
MSVKLFKDAELFRGKTTEGPRSEITVSGTQPRKRRMENAAAKMVRASAG